MSSASFAALLLSMFAAFLLVGTCPTHVDCAPSPVTYAGRTVGRMNTSLLIPIVESNGLMPQTRGSRGDRKRANSETIPDTGAVARAASPTLENNQNGNGKLAIASNGLKDIDDGCCCPSGCVIGEPIDPEDPDGAVPIICSNPDCEVGQYMHRVCFDTWEQSVLTHVRLSGRARNWSEKQMIQNLWTKKGFDVAYKACTCKCGHGHLRKDLDTLLLKSTTPLDDEARKRRNRKKSGSKQSAAPIGLVNNGISGASVCGLAPRARSRTLSVGSAAGMNMPNCDSPPIQNQACGASKSSCNLDFFSDVQVQNTGSIFQRRETMASFYEVLPSWKVNGIHIKMEDDCPQGNDETRIFVLTSLGNHKMREVPCVLCQKELTVFDKYPLIDGTLFMSPVNHGGLGVKVRHDARDGYLFALCIYCLEHSDQYHCARCGAKKWFVGDRLVLGTLYSYDVLAPVPCCPPTCKYCKHPLPMPSTHHFSAYSEPSVCPNCGSSDLHFIRQLENMKRWETAASA